MDAYEALVARLIADPDNGITDPQFHIRANMLVWLRIENGEVTGIDFSRNEVEPCPPGSSFVRDNDDDGDGETLSAADTDAVLDNAETWNVRLVEDDHGAVYYSE